MGKYCHRVITYIIRKDRPSNKLGGGVLLALCEEIQFNKINSAPWSDNLEILAIELLTDRDKLDKCLLCVCYRPPNSDLNEWFNLFASFLQFAEKYEKILLLGDFNFPDLVWNCDKRFPKSLIKISHRISGSCIRLFPVTS